MTHSESIKAIAPAIVVAQGELQSAPRDSSNPYFNSKYADLATCMDTLRPVLAKNGLAILQFPLMNKTDLIVAVETVLLHISGEWFSTLATCTVKDTLAQTVGAATTYLRRYGLAIIGLVTDDDDDGNAASEPQKPQNTVTFNQNAGNGARIDLKSECGKVQPPPAQTPQKATEVPYSPNPARGILADVSQKQYKDKKTGETRTYYIAALDNGEILACFEPTIGKAIGKEVGKEVEIPFILSKQGKKNFYEFAIVGDSNPLANEAIAENNDGLPF
jgi:hypothetical protein